MPTGEGRAGGGQASLWMPSPVGGLQWALDRRPLWGMLNVAFRVCLGVALLGMLKLSD